MTHNRATAEITAINAEPVSGEVLARTEYRGPPWDLSLLEGIELVESDGIPVASDLHRIQINLLVDVVGGLMEARGRTDCYVSGDLFVYYTPEQAHYVATHETRQGREFSGPDFLFVNGVESRPRRSWRVWDERNRYPDVIAELLSPSTAKTDKTLKRERYSAIFHTAEYYLYEPDSDHFTAYQLTSRNTYRDAERGADDRVYSNQLDAWFGLWQGTFQTYTATWLRIYQSELASAPIATREERERQRAERAEQRTALERQRTALERQRAERAEQRAADAQDEIARLRALLDAKNE